VSELWGRSWRVQVGPIVTEDCDVIFKVERTILGKPGTLDLQIFNLTSDNRKEIASLPRGTLVRVDAGYADSRSMIFRGDLRRADNHRDDGAPDWVTHVTAGDGENAMRTARAIRSFGAGATLQSVVTYLADAMGVGRGNITEVLADRVLDQARNTFPEGTLVHGVAAREMSRLLDSCGLSWSIQDGVFQIIPRGGSLARSAVLLSSDSGLIGSPAVGANHVVTAKSLMIPDLTPGQKVQLQSRAVTGLHRIEKSTHEGDTRGDEWGVTMDMRHAT
jgi:hypothetical protein